MPKPLIIKFCIDDKNTEEIFAKVSINRNTGEFYFFPQLKNGHYLLESSCNDIKIYDEVPEHLSLHKDGTIHIKYRENSKSKTTINKLEKPFSTIGRKTLVPVLSFSIRTANKENSVICLLAGKDIIENLSLLPKPYADFAVPERVKSLVDSANMLCFGHLFIFLPFFIPRHNKNLFSITAPLQESDLFDVCKNMISKI